MNQNNTNNTTEWTKRNIVDEPRLSELIEMYKELDFEVKLVEFDPKGYPQECSECMAANPEKYKVIYTRKIKKLPYP